MSRAALKTFAILLVYAYGIDAADPSWLRPYRLSDGRVGTVLDTLPLLNEKALQNNSLRQTSANDSAFESNLEFHGAKSVRASSGGGEFQLDQSLELDLEGALGRGVQVRGHLSDGDLPLGAGGASVTLRELDQVFLEFRGESWKAVLGDFPLLFERRRLTALRGEVQGVDLFYEDERYFLHAATGGARGAFRRVEMFGEEGRQSGYGLTSGGNYESVVPGSEKIWLDGERLKAGTDYRLDALSGTLDFTGSAIVSSESRILVEYEALNSDGRPSLTAGDMGWNSGSVRFDLQWMRRELRFDFLQDTLSLDTLTSRTLRHDMAGLGTEVQLARRFFFRVEGAASQVDSSAFPLRASYADARALTWFWTTDSTREHRYSAWRLQHSGAWYGWGFVPFASREEPETFRNKWNLSAAALDGDLRRDELRLDFFPARDWNLYLDAGRASGSFSEANLGNTFYSALYGGGVEHSSRQARGDVRLERSDSREELSRERDRLTWSAEDLRGILRPFALAELSRSKLDSSGRSLDVSALSGLRTTFAEGALDGKLHARVRQVKSNLNLPGLGLQDSLQSFELVQQSLWFPAREWEGDLLFQYRDMGRSLGRADSSRWESNRFWMWDWGNELGRRKRGWKLRSRYALQLGAERPDLRLYRQVPQGAGDAVFDSLTGEYREVDDGNLVFAGLGVDSTVQPVRARRLDLELYARFRTGPLFAIRKGLLRDLALEFSGGWSTQDTASEERWFPAFDDFGLDQSMEANSRLNAAVDWSLPDGSWDMGWKGRRNLSKSIGLFSGRELLVAHEVEADRQMLKTWHIVFLGESESIRRKNISRPLVTHDLLRVLLENPVQLSKGWLLTPEVEQIRATGTLAGEAVESLTMAAAATLRWEYRDRGYASARYGLVRVEDPLGKGFTLDMTRGFSRGLTHRAELSSRFGFSDGLSLDLRYVFRLEEVADLAFHKVTLDARALF